MECQTIENVLRQTEWNKSKAAKELGLTRTQRYVRLSRYGVENPETPVGGLRPDMQWVIIHAHSVFGSVMTFFEFWR